MVRVNKRQKQILNCLNRKFPSFLNYEVLLLELGNKPEDIVHLDDLKLKGLVDISCTDFIYPDGTKSHEAPQDSWITLDGRKIIKETFFKRLMLFLVIIIGIQVAIILALFKQY
jgi:hypothetical protein